LFYSTNTKYQYLFLLQGSIDGTSRSYNFYSNSSAYYMNYDSQFFTRKQLNISGTWSDNVFTCTSINYSVPDYFNLNNFVTTNTNQTIGNKKTFNTLPESSIVPTTDNQLVNKKYVDDTIASAITTTLNGGY